MRNIEYLRKSYLGVGSTDMLQSRHACHGSWFIVSNVQKSKEEGVYCSILVDTTSRRRGAKDERGRGLIQAKDGFHDADELRIRN
jgi:hypothetical protein